MYEYIRLSKKNMDILKSLNNDIYKFNELNENFFDEFYKFGFKEQLLLKNSIRLIRYEGDYLGFLWYEKIDKNSYNIRALYVTENYKEDMINQFLNKFKKNTTFLYQCKSNLYNYNILTLLGFKKHNSNLKLYKNVYNPYDLQFRNNIDFELFKEGQQEELRCSLQNEIFKNDDRIPLSIEDIFFDEIQDYYIKDSGLFLKYDNEYIGYGQIIMEEGFPTIANFGIVPKYRSKGYGIIFLKELINLSLDKGFSKINIKVASENDRALCLYKKLGFKIENEFITWKISK